jgi:hypothetical protein
LGRKNMTSINPFNPAYSGTYIAPLDNPYGYGLPAFARNVKHDSFESSHKKHKKLHPFKAILSHAFPGTGEILNGDPKGLYRLGFQGILAAAAIGLCKAKSLQNTLTGKIAFVTGIGSIGLLAAANSITSAINAARGRESHSEHSEDAGHSEH